RLSDEIAVLRRTTGAFASVGDDGPGVGKETFLSRHDMLGERGGGQIRVDSSRPVDPVRAEIRRFGTFGNRNRRNDGTCHGSILSSCRSAFAIIKGESDLGQA